jgi:hypothetical protein
MWMEQVDVPRRDRRPGGELELQDRIRDLLIDRNVARRVDGRRDGFDLSAASYLPDPDSRPRQDAVRVTEALPA